MRRVFGMMGAMTLLLSFVFIGSAGTALAAPYWNKDDGHFQHIFVIMMENQSPRRIHSIDRSHLVTAGSCLIRSSLLCPSSGLFVSILTIALPADNACLLQLNRGYCFSDHCFPL